MEELVRILQIIPASDWSAHYEIEGETNFLDPLVCFALVEVSSYGKKTQEVRPMSWSESGVEFCTKASNFSKISFGK